MYVKRNDPLLLNVPKRSRQYRLLVELNKRYMTWANSLPNPLNRMALRESTFLGGTSGGILEDLSKINPAITCLPWLFWEICSNVEDDVFITLAEAGASHILASIVMDHVIDYQVEDMVAMVLFHRAIYINSIMKFKEALPSNEKFWNSFDGLSKDHMDGLVIELSARMNPDLFTLDNFIKITHSKVSPFIIAIMAFLYAADQPSLCEQFASSLRYVSQASCLLDDMWDWKHDLERGHLTYFLTCLVPPEQRKETLLISKEHLQKHLDENWLDIEYFQSVIDWFDEAIIDVDAIDYPAWIEYIQGYREMAIDHAKIAMARKITSALSI